MAEFDAMQVIGLVNTKGLAGLVAAVDAMARAANILIANGLWRALPKRRIRS
jgi:hypothetical protein